MKDNAVHSPPSYMPRHMVLGFFEARKARVNRGEVNGRTIETRTYIFDPRLFQILFWVLHELTLPATLAFHIH